MRTSRWPTLAAEWIRKRRRECSSLSSRRSSPAGVSAWRPFWGSCADTTASSRWTVPPPAERSYVSCFPSPPGQAAPAKQQQEARPEQAHPAATVLVVDDEELVRAVATMTLSRYGFTVLNASDGYEALEVFPEAEGRDRRCSAGHDDARVSAAKRCCKSCARFAPTCALCSQSGYDERQATDRLAGGEPYGFLQKPYAPTALAEKMSAAVRGQRCP